MSDVKHTPGPWKAAPEANGEWGIDSATGWGIATVAGSAGPGPGDDESAANARLIAAAPELLETLQSLNAFVGVMVGRGPEATIWQIVGSSDPDVAPPNVEHLRPLADREKSAALVSPPDNGEPGNG